MRPDRVEVAQADDAQFGIRLGAVGKDLFDVQFRAAVRIGGLARRHLFGERKRLGRTVDGGGRAEDEGLHALGAHRFEKPKRTDDVVVVVLEGLFDRFADGLEAGEVNDGFDAVLVKRPPHGQIGRAHV